MGILLEKAEPAATAAVTRPPVPLALLRRQDLIANSILLARRDLLSQLCRRHGGKSRTAGETKCLTGSWRAAHGRWTPSYSLVLVLFCLRSAGSLACTSSAPPSLPPSTNQLPACQRGPPTCSLRVSGRVLWADHLIIHLCDFPRAPASDELLEVLVLFYFSVFDRRHVN